MYVYPFRPLNVTLENSQPISSLYQCIFQQKILFGISFVLKEVNKQPTQKEVCLSFGYFKGVMSQGYWQPFKVICVLKSLLKIPLPTHKMLLFRVMKIYQTNFIREHQPKYFFDNFCRHGVKTFRMAKLFQVLIHLHAY